MDIKLKIKYSSTELRDDARFKKKFKPNRILAIAIPLYSIKPMLTNFRFGNRYKFHFHTRFQKQFLRIYVDADVKDFKKFINTTNKFFIKLHVKYSDFIIVS